MKKFLLFCFFGSFFLLACSNNFSSNSGTVCISVPYGSSARAVQSEENSVSYDFTFDLFIEGSPRIHKEAKSGDVLTITDIPVGSCTMEVNAFVNENETADYTGTSVFYVLENEITSVPVKLKRTDKSIEYVEFLFFTSNGLVINDEQIDWKSVLVKNKYSDGSRQKNFVSITQLYDITIDENIIKDKSYVGNYPVKLKDKVFKQDLNIVIPAVYSLEKGAKSTIGPKVQLSYNEETNIFSASCTNLLLHYIDKAQKIIEISVPFSVTGYEWFLNNESVSTDETYTFTTSDKTENEVYCKLSITADLTGYENYSLLESSEAQIQSESAMVTKVVVEEPEVIEDDVEEEEEEDPLSMPDAGGQQFGIVVNFPESEEKLSVQFDSYEFESASGDMKIKIEDWYGNYDTLTISNMKIIFNGTLLNESQVKLVSEDGKIPVVYQLLGIDMSKYGYYEFVVIFTLQDGTEVSEVIDYFNARGE